MLQNLRLNMATVLNMNQLDEIKCRKWTLFGLTIIAIGIQIIVTILAVKLIKYEEKPNILLVNVTETQWEEGKVIFIVQ